METFDTFYLIELIIVIYSRHTIHSILIFLLHICFLKQKQMRIPAISLQQSVYYNPTFS